MMRGESVKLDRVFHALADPTRRAVLRRLSRSEAAVTELAAPFAMALPTFLQHLRVLENSGLVHSKKSGRVRTCHINPQGLGRAEGWMMEQREIWEQRLDQLDHYLTTLKENPYDI